jgi:type I restriction enzyme M protein
MFVQHMVAVLRPGGMVCTVMPHGVLFRGGAERDIRKGFIQDDLLDAVIGLAPNVFYGTGIPACILVLRAKGAKPPERQGKVLFINADAEFRAGRAQNFLDPEHIEKIVSAYERYADIPGFAALVPHATLQENDWNLNIRRYADNAPPPEPHDVKAHLLGGVPKAEVQAKADLFAAHGFDPTHVFTDRDDRYYDFRPELTGTADLKQRVESDPGVQAREQRLISAFDAWWADHEGLIAGLPETKGLMALRTELLESFGKALVPAGLLDRFQVAGAIATWWGDSLTDLKTLMARGFEGVVEGWVTTILTALEEDGNNADPLDHKLVKKLLPEFLDEIAEAEAQVFEMDGTMKAATATSDAEDEDIADEEETLSEEQLKELKKTLSAAKAKLKALKKGLAERLEAAQAEVDASQARELMIGLLKGDLGHELDRRVSADRQRILATLENWWAKYRIALRDIERGRSGATARLDQLLKELEYAR